MGTFATFIVSNPVNSLHMTPQFLLLYCCKITLLTLKIHLAATAHTNLQYHQYYHLENLQFLLQLTLQFLPLYCCEITLITLIISIPLNSLHMTLQFLPFYCCEMTFATFI